VARLLWVPRLETAMQAARLAVDACGVPYVARTYDDKCHVGTVAELKRYAVSPRPAAYGTSADVRKERDAYLADLRKAMDDLRNAKKLRDRKRGRYDLVMDVLKLMAEAWELENSGLLAQLVADVNARDPASPYASTPANYAMPDQLPIPTNLSAPAPIPPLDGALVNDGPAPATDHPLPGVPKPTFVVMSYAAKGDGGALWPLMTDPQERYSTSPAMCAPGYHVVAVNMTIANSNVLIGGPDVADMKTVTTKSQVNANVLCYNPATGDSIVVSSDPTLVGPVWAPRQRK